MQVQRPLASGVEDASRALRSGSLSRHTRLYGRMTRLRRRGRHRFSHPHAKLGRSLVHPRAAKHDIPTKCNFRIDTLIQRLRVFLNNQLKRSNSHLVLSVVAAVTAAANAQSVMGIVILQASFDLGKPTWRWLKPVPSRLALVSITVNYKGHPP